ALLLGAQCREPVAPLERWQTVIHEPSEKVGPQEAKLFANDAYPLVILVVELKSIVFRINSTLDRHCPDSFLSRWSSLFAQKKRDINEPTAKKAVQQREVSPFSLPREKPSLNDGLAQLGLVTTLARYYQNPLSLANLFLSFVERFFRSSET